MKLFSTKIITDDSSGGFLAVDRNEAIRENWADILTMERPATVPSSSQTEKTKVVLEEVAQELGVMPKSKL